ncbi:hypothetical protein LSUB1_G003843 [Lachnellula subtilissima]|uniref:Uncharacterized protein n=1 Tax=Lachnellula subtilissima TaxID=602034 RepID=A0A8H8U674_9HELO|nr:hypothetical protein LSUB1_G003843 [Lachnellula subtilissima]
MRTCSFSEAAFNFGRKRIETRRLVYSRRENMALSRKTLPIPSSLWTQIHDWSVSYSLFKRHYNLFPFGILRSARNYILPREEMRSMYSAYLAYWRQRSRSNTYTPYFVAKDYGPKFIVTEGGYQVIQSFVTLITSGGNLLFPPSRWIGC